MAGYIWPANAVTGAPSYTGKMLRNVLGALFGGKSTTRPLGARSGITSEPTLAVTTTTYTVGPFGGVLDVEASAVEGPYSFGFDANSTGSVNAAHATLPRWDLLYVQMDDPAAGDGTTTPAVRVAYLAGTANASPALPATPARSIVLAKIIVPQSGGGSPTISLIAPYTAAAGGVIRCRDSTEYPLSAAVDQLVSDDALQGRILRWDGDSWEVPGDTGWVNLTPAVGSGTCRYEQIGKAVNLDIVMTGIGTIAAGGSVTLVAAGGIPAAARPSTTKYVAAFSGTAVGYVQVNTDGSMVLRPSTGSMTSAASSPSYFAG